MFRVYTSLAGNSSARSFVGSYATLRGARRAASSRIGYGVLAVIVDANGAVIA